jgi:hypothetical protein
MNILSRVIVTKQINQLRTQRQSLIRVISKDKDKQIQRIRQSDNKKWYGNRRFGCAVQVIMNQSLGKK